VDFSVACSAVWVTADAVVATAAETAVAATPAAVVPTAAAPVVLASQVARMSRRDSGEFQAAVALATAAFFVDVGQ